MSRFLPAILALLIHVGITTWFIVGALPHIDPIILPPEKTALPPRLWSFKTEAIDQLVTELQSEREKIEAERKGLMAMQGRLEAEKVEVEKVRAEVQAVRDEVAAHMLELEENEVKNLKTLSQTYTAMAPTPVVAILREMDDSQAAKILALMKSDKVGAILGEWVKAADRPNEEPMAKRAAAISDKLRLMKPIKKSA